MANRGTEAANPLSTFNKTPDNEPIFILRAQDELSSGIVRIWAGLAKLKGTPDHKVAEALEIADRMDAWPVRRHPD